MYEAPLIMNLVRQVGKEDCKPAMRDCWVRVITLVRINNGDLTFQDNWFMQELFFCDVTMI